MLAIVFHNPPVDNRYLKIRISVAAFGLTLIFSMSQQNSPILSFAGAVSSYSFLTVLTVKTAWSLTNFRTRHQCPLLDMNLRPVSCTIVGTDTTLSIIVSPG